MRNKIQRAALQPENQSLGVFEDPESDLLQLARGTPVIVKALQNHAVLYLAGDEFVGAGSDRGGFLCCIVCRDDVGVHNRCEEFIARGGKGDGQDIVAGIQGGNNLKRSEVGRGIVVLPAALQRINNVLHRNRIAVMELHAFTQGKCIREAVVRFCDLRCDCRNDFPVRVGLYQPFEDIE